MPTWNRPSTRSLPLEPAFSRDPARPLCECAPFLHRVWSDLVHDPTTPARQYWERFQVLLLSLVAFVTPYQMAFRVPLAHPSYAVTHCAVILCVPHIALQLFGGNFGVNGMVVHDRATLRRMYYASDLLFDLIAIPPMVQVAAMYSPNLAANLVDSHTLVYRGYWGDLVWMGANRLAVVIKIVQWFRGHVTLLSGGGLRVQMVYLMFLLTLMLHLFACLTWYLAIPRIATERTWTFHDDFSLHTSSTPTQYGMSLYRSLNLLFSQRYAKKNTFSEQERYQTSILRTVGRILLGYIMAKFTALLSNSLSHKITHQNRIRYILEYVHRKRVDRDLQRRLKKHYQLQWQESNGLPNGNHLLADLPQSARADIMAKLNVALFRSIPLFSNCDESFIRAVSSRLDDIFFPPNEYIVRKGDWGSELYLIRRGVCEVIDEDGDETVQILGTLNPGSWFGEISVFMACRRTATIKTKSNMTVAVLRKEDLDVTLAYFPAVREGIMSSISNKLVGDVDRRRRMSRANTPATGFSPTSSARQLADDSDEVYAHRTLHQAEQKLRLEVNRGGLYSNTSSNHASYQSLEPTALSATTRGISPWRDVARLDVPSRRAEISSFIHSAGAFSIDMSYASLAVPDPSPRTLPGHAKRLTIIPTKLVQGVAVPSAPVPEVRNATTLQIPTVVGRLSLSASRSSEYGPPSRASEYGTANGGSAWASQVATQLHLAPGVGRSAVTSPAPSRHSLHPSMRLRPGKSAVSTRHPSQISVGSNASCDHGYVTMQRGGTSSAASREFDPDVSNSAWWNPLRLVRGRQHSAGAGAVTPAAPAPTLRAAQTDPRTEASLEYIQNEELRQAMVPSMLSISSSQCSIGSAGSGRSRVRSSDSRNGAVRGRSKTQGSPPDTLSSVRSAAAQKIVKRSNTSPPNRQQQYLFPGMANAVMASGGPSRPMSRRGSKYLDLDLAGRKKKASASRASTKRAPAPWDTDELGEVRAAQLKHVLAKSLDRDDWRPLAEATVDVAASASGAPEARQRWRGKSADGRKKLTTPWSASVLNSPRRLTAGKHASKHAAAVPSLDAPRDLTSPAPSKATSSDQSASTASTSPLAPHPSATDQQTGANWPRTHSMGIMMPTNESSATILASGGCDPRRSPVSVQQNDRAVQQFVEGRPTELTTARGPADLHPDMLPESISLPPSSSPQ
ncbi:Kinesin-like protein kif27 [Allomyces arbusculus]|nr:Kinesin-like protein kif27 [Allomyces arbusculus]